MTTIFCTPRMSKNLSEGQPRQDVHTNQPSHRRGVAAVQTDLPVGIINYLQKGSLRIKPEEDHVDQKIYQLEDTELKGFPLAPSHSLKQLKGIERRRIKNKLDSQQFWMDRIGGATAL